LIHRPVRIRTLRAALEVGERVLGCELLFLQLGDQALFGLRQKQVAVELGGLHREL